MTDLRTLLHEASTPRDHTDPETHVAADLERGRRALRRGRVRVVRSGLVGAAAAGVVTVVLQSGMVPATGPEVAPVSPGLARETTDRSPQPSAPLTLVAYEGAQPTGFRIDKLPAGWEVARAEREFLVLRLVDGDRLPDPMSGEIVISQWPADFPEDSSMHVVAEVPVGDVTGQVLRLKDGWFKDLQVERGLGDRPILRVPQSPGVRLEVIFPSWLNWSPEQLAEFGAAIRVTEDATVSEGVG